MALERLLGITHAVEPGNVQARTLRQDWARDAQRQQAEKPPLAGIGDWLQSHATPRHLDNLVDFLHGGFLNPSLFADDGKLDYLPTLVALHRDTLLRKYQARQLQPPSRKPREHISVPPLPKRPPKPSTTPTLEPSLIPRVQGPRPA